MHSNVQTFQKYKNEFRNINPWPSHSRDPWLKNVLSKCLSLAVTFVGVFVYLPCFMGFKTDSDTCKNQLSRTMIVVNVGQGTDGILFLLRLGLSHPKLENKPNAQHKNVITTFIYLSWLSWMTSQGFFNTTRYYYLMPFPSAHHS